MRSIAFFELWLTLGNRRFWTEGVAFSPALRVTASRNSRHFVKTGTEALEPWVPLGGFQLEHRLRGKTPEGETLITDWLVPVLAYDGVSSAYPCAEQPCLHRVLVASPHDQVVKLPACMGS